MTKRQTVLVHYLKDNDHLHHHNKPESEIFYHHIVETGKPIPFQFYSDYLSDMSSIYPYLRINVFFLTDDSHQSYMRWPRHTRLNKFVATSTNHKVDENLKLYIEDFEKSHQNVNITITPLSKYMTTTPLKYKWRTIPISYLTFYLRIYAVWQQGGIGIDLPIFYNKYMNNEQRDEKYNEVLRNFNENIDNPVINHNVLRQDDGDLSMLLFGLNLINQVWNETRSFLNYSLPWSGFDKYFKNCTLKSQDIHRNKREVTNLNINDTKVIKNNITNSSIAEENKNNPNASVLKTFVKLLEKRPLDHIIVHDKKVNAIETSNRTNVTTIEPLNVNKSTANNLGQPQMFLFYDFSVMSDAVGPSFNIPQSAFGDEVPMFPDIRKQSEDSSQHLFIDSDGNFIASLLRFHPFLGHLISTGNKRLSPKFAIEETILTHCSGIFHTDSYCNNINYI